MLAMAAVYQPPSMPDVPPTPSRSQLAGDGGLGLTE
jgi:hypothetical protein